MANINEDGKGDMPEMSKIMNPFLNFLRSPQGRALVQHAIEAAGQHIIEVVTKAGTAGATVQRANSRVERHKQRVFQQQQDRHRQQRDDTHLKDAEVLDVRVGETYKYDSTSDPEAP